MGQPELARDREQRRRCSRGEPPSPAIVGVVMSLFAIVVTDGRTGNKLELCRVGTNPEPVAEGARRKTYKLGKRVLRLYSNVEVVEIAKGAVVRS